MIEPNALEPFVDGRTPDGLGGLFYGVYPALVVDNVDPARQGGLKIRLPWAADTVDGFYEVWARLATFMAGKNRGAWFIPDPNDEVLVMFEGGDPRRPYVIGALWNGGDTPPETMDSAGLNTRKVLRSRNGVKITLDDSDGRELLTLETPGGQKLTLKDGPGTIELADSNGNLVKLEPAGITLTSSAKLTVSATQVEISAGIVTVNAGMSTFSGVAKADTVISNSVISASYTPGAGNIW